jgi:hypothetical protein
VEEGEIDYLPVLVVTMCPVVMLHQAIR